jgi:hypothetical protein
MSGWRTALRIAMRVVAIVLRPLTFAKGRDEFSGHELRRMTVRA